MPPKPRRSEMMDKLYGEEEAIVVYDRCQELGERFNDLVQGLVYDKFWADPSLAIKDKSLVTIISLIILNKAEQLQIHIKGFLNLGGTLKDIAQILEYLHKTNYITSSQLEKTHAIISEIFGEASLELSDEEKNFITDSPHNKDLIDLSASIALGDQTRTEECMQTLLINKNLSREKIENVMLHQLLYCGFPCAMNGYAALLAAEELYHIPKASKR